MGANEQVDERIGSAPGFPDVLRIRADNPGPMTLSGTNTYLVGRDPVWVIDPGPADPDHIGRIRAVAEGRGGIGGVVLTHSHSDHNAGVEMLGAPLRLGTGAGFDDLAALVSAVDADLPEAPSAGAIGPFEAILTPGHATDHVAFAFGEVCFCGDLVLGEGSSIVPPAAGGGSVADYLASLRTLAGRDLTLLCPGHGPWIDDPAAKLAEYEHHRLERERLLLAALAEGRRSTDELLDVAWSDVPAPMRPAAALAMRAHLEKLADDGALPSDVQL